MDWIEIISVLIGGTTLMTLISVIRYKRSTTMGKIEPPEITRHSFEDGFDMGTFYLNEVKRMAQQSQTPLQTNCPNCGAPLENGKCPYCGTQVSHTVSLDDITPFHWTTSHHT